MNARKIFALLLALALCVGTLAACDSKPAETTAPAAEGTTAPATTTAPVQETTEPKPLTNAERYPISSDHTFTIATGFSGVEKADNWKLMVDTIGLNVEWKVVAQEQTALLFLDKEQMPDMFVQPYGLSNVQINEYGEAGLLVNYAEYLDLMPNLQRWMNEHPKFLDSVIQEDGSFYMLPGYANSLTSSSHMFYVRTDMTTEAGWEKLPETVEDFLVMCEDLKTTFADVEGYVPMVCNGPSSLTYNGGYTSFFFPAFGELMQTEITTNADATKIEVGFATEQFKNWLSFAHTLYEKGYMDPDCFVAESNTNKAKMIEGSTTMNPTATYLTPENFASGEMDFQLMPPLASQYQSEARWALPNRYVARTYMISSDCPDIESAVKFMDAFYAFEDDPLNEEGTVWNISQWLGEFGVDYIRNDEEGWYAVQEHEGFDSAVAWLGTAGTGSTVAGDWPYYENSGTGLMMKAIGRRDILNPHGVEVFYTSLLNLTQEEKDIYADCWTNISTYVTEMNAAFITGQKDVEAEWDTYISTLNDMGLQDVIDVYQAALDRYNAR